MVAISAEKTNAIQAIFSRNKVVIGVIHCDPFPGTPKYRGKSVPGIVERALRDAENYISGGVHGLIIENHGDIPSKPEDIGHETSALMAVITEKVRERFGVPLGINVLANAAIPAMAIALAGGADFVRVNQWANAYIANEGFIEGAAAKALRYRSMLRAEHIRVFADSHVKHGSHAIVADRSIQELTRDVDFFEADAVIATGQRTGDSDALLLPARELGRIGISFMRQSHSLQQFPGVFTRLRTFGAQHFYWRHHDVFHHRHVGKQIEVLKDETDTGAQLVQTHAAAVDIYTIKQNLPLLDRLQAVHRANQR